MDSTETKTEPAEKANEQAKLPKQEVPASQSSLVKKKPQAKRKSKKGGVYTKAKRKTAVARAVIKKGRGHVTINNRLIDVLQPAYVRTLISEPLKIAGDACRDVDIDVNVHGGGFMGQAISARGAIAKALVEYTNDSKLKQRMLAHDRMLLVDDVRQVEPKKPLGPKARRKKQKSKR